MGLALFQVVGNNLILGMGGRVQNPLKQRGKIGDHGVAWLGLARTRSAARMEIAARVETDRGSVGVERLARKRKRRERPPGLPLAASVAIARGAHVPLAIFVTRRGIVVDEEWHSYTTPTQETGPALSMPQARGLARTLMGAEKPLLETQKRTGWASFPVFCLGYANDRWVVFESKHRATRVWGLLAIASWYWAESISVNFLMPAGHARLEAPGRQKLLKLLPHGAPRPTVRAPRRSAEPEFPSGF